MSKQSYLVIGYPSDDGLPNFILPFYSLVDAARHFEHHSQEVGERLQRILLVSINFDQDIPTISPISETRQKNT